MAGVAGLEPATAGVKVPCLTTWRHPIMATARLEINERAGTDVPALSRRLGWVKGLEPSTPGTTIRCSNQLSYTHHIKFARSVRKNGTPEGIRTPDPLLRRQLLYPTELQAHITRGSRQNLGPPVRFNPLEKMERVMGIEPTRPAWKAGILPLNYTRISRIPEPLACT